MLLLGASAPAAELWSKRMLVSAGKAKVASYLTRVTLHQVKLLKSLVIGWWMVLGKLALLEYRYVLCGFIANPHTYTTGRCPGPSLLQYSYHKYDCLKNNDAECLSAQICLGREKLTQ